MTDERKEPGTAAVEAGGEADRAGRARSGDEGTRRGGAGARCGRAGRTAALTAVAAMVVVAACGPAVAPGPAPAPAPGPDPVTMEPVDPMQPVVARPVPAPVVPPPFFRQALQADTRSPTGRPGEDYWVNRADYDIEAALDPATGRLTASETIRYVNRSPDTLPLVVLHLHQNLHRAGVARNEPQEITGGVELGDVRVAGQAAQAVPVGGQAARAPAYQVNGTLMQLLLDRPLLPGETREIEIDWATTIPQSGAGRMGWSEREVYFVGYWFPKMAVYDDLRGWDAEPYLGGAEFYDEFGGYDVRLTVPEGWTVMATGDLENPTEVYRPEILERIEVASRADTVVQVVGPADHEADRVTVDAPGDLLTYRFAAENVRDFTFTASDVQVWDATSAEVPDRDGDGAMDRVLIHTFWRPDAAPLWAEQALYAKHAIEHHSRYSGVPYPWPHMTSVEGTDIIGGGMEFPMLTVMGPYTERGAQDLYNVTSHELAHMWVPMIVGTNEKRYAWMDEGMTVFLEDEGRPEFWPGTDAHGIERENYLAVARAELEQPLMRHGDYYEPGPGYGTASYPKPATMMVLLRGLIGEEAFLEGYRSFLADWSYGHPTPWDLFNTFERTAGRDLDWFWTPFFYETWTLDHAVAEVRPGPGGGGTVVVEDRGWAVLPATVVIETSAGGTIERTVPVETWLEGATRVELDVPASAGTIERVEVSPEEWVPDIDRSDNVWRG